MAYKNKKFKGEYDWTSIENFIAYHTLDRPGCWKDKTGSYLRNEAAMWWKSLDSEFLKLCSVDEIEELLLDEWSHTRKEKTTTPSNDLIFTGKKETKKPKGLFSVGISLL